jgi:hypothetical protein
VGSLTSKRHLSVEGGDQLLVILSPVSSAIEVRTVINRVAALCRPWCHELVAQDVQERPLAFMTLN